MVDVKSMDLEPSSNNSFFADGTSADQPKKNKIHIVAIPNDLYTADETLLVVGTSVWMSSAFSNTVSDDVVVGCGWRALYRDGGVGAIMDKVTSRYRTETRTPDNPRICCVTIVGRNAVVQQRRIYRPHTTSGDVMVSLIAKKIPSSLKLERGLLSGSYFKQNKSCTSMWIEIKVWE